MRRRRSAGISSLILAATLVAGCSDDGDGGGIPGRPAPPGRSAAAGNSTASTPAQPDSGRLFAAGTVTVMWCDGLSGGLSTFGAVLASYRVTDGGLAAQRQLSFPSESVPEYVCGASGAVRSQQQVRQLFNKDFTLLVGVVRGANGQGRQATALDLVSGRVVGPRPDPNAFGVAPQHFSPTFQPGTDVLWYQDQDRRIRSRDARTPQAPETDHGFSENSGFMLGGPDGTTVWSPLSWSMVSASAEAISPAGTVAAVYSDTYGMRLVRNGQEGPVGPKVGAPSYYGDKALPGGDGVPPGCSPRFWTAPTVLVCGDARTLVRVTFTPDFASISAVENLLPANDRTNSEAVLSADGHTAYFVSQAGSGTPALYRLPLDTPGSVPAKVTDLTGPANARGAQLHLLTAQ